MIIEKLIVKGNYKFILKETGKPDIVRRVDNMIMRSPLYAMINTLLGYTPDLSVQRCAVGTGTTAVAVDNTQLAAEYARVYRSDLYRDGYMLFSEFVFTKSEANTTLTEAGVFLNAVTCTATANTGDLWSRVLLSPAIAKTSAQELVIQYTNVFSRG
jgi:hypothetical protein